MVRASSDVTTSHSPSWPIRAGLASDAPFRWAPVAAQTIDHPSSPTRWLRGPLQSSGQQQVGGDKRSSDLLQRHRGWNGHAGHTGAGIRAAKGWVSDRFLQRQLLGGQSKTQDASEDLHCIICAKKPTQSPPLRYK